MTQPIIPHVADNLTLKYRGADLSRTFAVKDFTTLVVGTGRCGTVFVAKLLTSAGLPCGHECVFRHDGFDRGLARLRGEEPVELSEISKLASLRDEEQGNYWFGDTAHVSADSSYMAAPYLDRPELADKMVVHVVRNPIQVVNSFAVGFKYFKDYDKLHPTHKPYHDFIYEHVPEVKEKADPISRAAWYVVRWNEMIEAKARPENYYRHRVEVTGKKLLWRLGLDAEKSYANTKCNHRVDMPDFVKSYADIPDRDAAAALEGLARRYGYGRATLL